MQINIAIPGGPNIGASLFPNSLARTTRSSADIAAEIRNISIEGWTLGGTGANITFTTTTGRAVTGEFDITVLSLGSGGTTNTQLNDNDFVTTVVTEGEDPATSPSLDITIPNGEVQTFELFPTAASVQSQDAAAIAAELNRILTANSPGWMTAYTAGSRLVTLNHQMSGDVPQWQVVVNNLGTAGTQAADFNNADFVVATTTPGTGDTTAGRLTLTLIDSAGTRTTFYDQPQSGLTALAVADIARAQIDANDAFSATGTGGDVIVQTTAFGSEAPTLEVVATVGTFRNADGSITDNQSFVTAVQRQIRDTERPWPITLINEGLNFVVGSSRLSGTSYNIRAFDLGSSDNGSDITSYVERKNIHLRPTKHTEMVHTFFLDAEGDTGSTADMPQFNVRVNVTNAAGLANTVNLSG